MRRFALVAIAVAGALVITSGCTQILGDFTIGNAKDGGGTKDQSVADAFDPPDTSPTCGVTSQSCCPMGNPCVSPTAQCCDTVSCTDTLTDPNNCGMCGRACNGGGCANGLCQAVAVGGVNTSDPGPLRLDGSFAYFGTVNNGSGYVYSCDLVQGCSSPTQLFNQIQLFDIAVSPAKIYVSTNNGGTIYDQVKGGNTTMQHNMSLPTGLDFSNGELYAMVQTVPMQFPKDFSSTITLNSGAGEGGTDIAASNTGYVYWTTSSDIRVGKSSTTNVESVYVSQFMGERPQTITASGQYVAWISKLSDGSGTSTVWACAATSSCSKSVPLASKQFAGQHVGNITFDASDIVYWTATDSAGKNVFVYSCAPTGCNNNKPTVVAQVPTQGKAFAGGVAVDNTFAYFLVGDGNGTTLFKVQK